MALSNLSGRAGSACGASDKPEEKPAACGSACGAGDKRFPAPPPARPAFAGGFL